MPKDESNNFITRCLVYMRDLVDNESLDGRRDEILEYYVNFENPGGVIYHGKKNGDEYWELDSGSGNLVKLHIESDGALDIYDYDYDAFLMSTYIDAPQELAELFYFLGNVKESELRGSGNKIVKIRDIIESVYITIPTKDGQKLWPYDVRSLKRIPQDIKDYIMSILNEDNSDPEFWPIYLEENNRYEYFSDLVDCCERDIYIKGLSIGDFNIVLDKTDTMKTWGELYPRLVLRISDKYSILYLRDYLKYSIEGREISEELLCLNNGSEIPKKLNIELPRKKIKQIQKSIELRNHIRNYKGMVSHLTSLAEPFDGIMDRYKKRIENLKFVHHEFLYEINEIKNPLPSMLEHPYRLFRRADVLTKQKTSQHLLNLLIKIPLFLMLEELELKCTELSKKYFDKIYNPKPLSDGAWASILRELIGDVVNNDIVQLKIFNELVLAINKEYMQGVKSVIEARNRCHHAPYDCNGFVKICDEVLPKLVDGLRDGLRDTMILQVISLGVNKEGSYVKAYKLAGHDRVYETKTIQTKEKLEQYPEDNLVAYNASKDKVVTLNNFFDSQQAPVSTINISIFDRMSESNEPEFTDI